jgi:crotonobetainyl-CoA:carnitine CoA-transferase CaiB-like acyl-CoA transferase
VTLGALEPKFWAAWCQGVGREDLIEKQFEAPGSDAHREVEAIFRERTRADWTEFASNHDCCLEPVLDLGEALDSDLVKAREMVVTLDQPGTDGVRQIGVPVKLSRTPGGVHGPAPAFGEQTREVLEGLGYGDEDIEALEREGATAGPPAGSQGSFLA